MRADDGHRGGGVAEVPFDQVPHLRGVVGLRVDPLEQSLGEAAEVVGQAVEVGVARAFGHVRERMSGRERAHPIQADGEATYDNGADATPPTRDLAG